LLGVIGSSEGQPYSDSIFPRIVTTILALYYDQGFSDARFSADVEKVPSSDPPRVRLKYHIMEGPQVLVARVLLGGYEHTRRGIIARQVGIRAGQPLSEGAVVETQRKLYNLGIFSRVTIAPQNPEGTNTQKTVVVMVDEGQTLHSGLWPGFRGAASGKRRDRHGLSAAPRAILEITKANFTGRADAAFLQGAGEHDSGARPDCLHGAQLFCLAQFQSAADRFFEKVRNIQTFTSRQYQASVQLTQKLSSTSSMLYRYAYRKVIRF